MASPDSTIRLGQVGLEESIDKAIRKVNASGRLKLNINSNSFTQPLGRITAATDEFTKSIEASNARVIAFGASVGVINAISNAFKNLVKETVALEQRLTEVNVVLGANTDQLKSFGKELFNIARNTSQSFDAVSQAALEFSRQGLSVEETLKRTNDALILSRLTGLKAADSVKGLTATMNSFAQAGLSTAEVINKLAAVDVKFAVSSEDLINALSRAGSVAQDAGLNFDELIAAVTSAQQTTARGGAVIGNSFKTIFTRIQRSDTLDRLQELGIAVRNVQGETLPAMMILQQLAKSYDGLTDATKSAVAEQVGGVFQINILKAALRDLNNENSIYSRAVLTSAGATDQAIVKNEQLNKTLDSLSKQTITSVQELSAAIGEITVGPGIEKVLNAINDLSQGASKLLDGEGIGSTLANGVLKGLGTVISGPGLVLIGGLMLKLFVDTTKFATSSFKNLLGLNKKSQEQKALQDSILATLQSNRQISAVLAQLEGNKAAQSKFLLDQVQKTTTEYTKQVNLAKQLAASLGQAGVVGGAGGLSMRTGRRAAHGFIPNFSAEGREMMDIKKGVGGVSPSAKPVRLKNFNMGGGRIGDMVANSQEYYVKNFNGRGGDAVFNPDMVQKYGMPYGAKKINASNGYVPNFAGGSLGVAAGSFKAVSQQFAGQSVPAFLKGKTGEQVARDYKQLAQVSIDDDKLLNADRSLDAAGRFWGGAQLKELGVNEEVTNSIRNQAKKIRANRNKNPIKIVVDAQKGKNSTGYGVVTVENVGTTKLNSFPDIIPSKVFKRADFDKTVRFDLKNIAVASVSSQTDPELSELIDKEVFRSVESIANELIGSHKLTENVNKDRIELSDVLDKSAGPQLKGRMFESIVDYMALRLAEDRGEVPTKTANQLFDYEKGIPKQLNKVFSNPDNILKDLKIDAKASMSAGSSGPGSMVKKILEDKLSGGAKEKLREKIRKLPESQRVLNFSSGYIPNFAGGVKVSDIPALSDSVMREKAAGIPSSAIRINTDKRLANSGNPNGLAVTNVIDEPRGMRDVFASRGYVPNFAAIPNVTELSSDQIKGAKGKELDAEIEKQEKLLKKYNSILNQTIQSTEKYQKRIEEAAQNTSDLKSQKGDINKKQSDSRAEKKLNEKRIAQLKQEIRSGTGGGQTSNAQTRAKRQELANLLKQNTKLKQEDVRLSQQSNAISRQILESEKAEQKAQKKLARTTEAQAKAAERKLIAERNSANLSSSRNQRRESRGAAMQNIGLQAIFVGPMIASAIEEAVFKGMDRAEMTRGQRQAQAALQGVGTGISSAGVLAQILMGFAKMNPYVRIASIAFAGLAPVILKFLGAAELTTDELIAQNEKRKQAANDELAAAEQILNARKILADPANYSQNELDAASKALKDNFTKITDVNLQKALLDNKTSFEQATKAVQDFRNKTQVQEGVLTAASLGFGSDFKAEASSSVLDFAKATGSSLSSIGASQESLNNLIKTLRGYVREGAIAVKDIENTRLGSFNVFQDERSNFAKSFKQSLKEIYESAGLPLEKASENADLITRAFLSSKKEKIRGKKLTPEAFRNVKNFVDTLINTLKISEEVAKDIAAAEAKRVEEELKISQLQPIKDSLERFVLNNLSETAKQIENIKFSIQINDKIRSFQESVLKGAIPSQDFIDFKSSGQISKIQTEFQQKQKEFINKNIKKLSDDLAEVFGREAGDIGGKAAADLTGLFAENPAQALEEIVSFLEKGSDGAEALKARLEAAGLDAGEKIQNLNEININTTDGAKALRDSAKELLTSVNLEKDNLVRRQAIVAVEKTIAETQANNALVVAKTQQDALLKNLDLSKQIRENNFQLEKATTDIDFNINDPRQQLGGNAEIRRVARLEEDKVRLKFQTEEANRLIEIEKGISDIFKDQALINAMGANTSSVDRLTDSNYELLKSNTEKRISEIKAEKGGRIGELEKKKEGITSKRNELANDNEIGLKRLEGASDEHREILLRDIGLRTKSMEDLRLESEGIESKIESIEKEASEKIKKLSANLNTTTTAQESAKALALSQSKINITSPDLQEKVLDIVRGRGEFSAAQNKEDKLFELDYVLLKKGFSDENITKIQKETARLIDLFEQGEISAKKLKESIANIGKGVDVDLYKNTFQGGVDAFNKGLDTELDSFGYRIGNEFPAAFRDNMTQAFSAIINRADNLGDTLLGIANQFLQTMQQAFLQEASGQAMRFFGFGRYNGGPIKKYANGGAVSNNAVPAMVTNGEYVIGKDAASRLGPEKLEMLNNGTFPMDGYASGGKVSTKSREAYAKHMNMFGTSFDDTKSAKFYNSLWREVPKAQREVALKQAADQEAESEAQMKAQQRKQRRAQIFSLIGSAALAFGMSKLVSSANLSALNSGQAASLKLPGISEGISGKMVQGSGFVPSSLNNLSLDQTEALDIFNSKLGGGKMTSSFLKDQGASFNLIPNKYNGGPIQAYASGGQVRGPAGRDVIPAVLTEGEYVIKASSARKYGKRFLDNLNQGGRAYYNGGSTSNMQSNPSQNFNLNMSFDVNQGGESSAQGVGSGDKSQDQGINQFAQNIRKLVQEEIQKEQRVGGLLRGTRR